MKNLIDRVHAIIRDHPDGISSPEIRIKLNSDKPHERCMVAHVLTQLYRAKKVDREHLVSNSAKTYLYKATMSSRQFVKKIILDNPGIASSEIRKQFEEKTGRNGYTASTLLSKMSAAGTIVRRKIKKDGRVQLCYFTAKFPGGEVTPPDAEQVIAKVSTPAPITGSMNAAALICDLMAELHSADAIYAAACADCAERIRQFAA